MLIARPTPLPEPTLDPLTGGLDRLGFLGAVDRLLAPEGASGALLVVDLDRFADLEAAVGSAVSDAIFAAVAGQLRDLLRPGDALARTGGNELAVFLPGADRPRARALSTRFLAAVAGRRHETPAGAQRLGASAGLALAPGHGRDATALFAAAALALRLAKRRGRHRLAIYRRRDGRAAVARQRRSTVLREALDQGRLVAFAQPIYDLRRRRVAAHELLMRVRSRGGRWLRPGALIADAERCGLIAEVDRWVVDQAVELLARAAAAGLERSLTINLSASAFADRTLLTHLRRRLRSSGVDPSRLILELTETTALADLSRAATLLAEARRLGCRIALDDFGSGYASSDLVRRLPLDLVKLDGGLIRGLGNDPSSRAWLQGLTGMLHALGVEVVGEHVEGFGALRFLARAGVDYAQGDGIGRPEPGDSLLVAPPERTADPPLAGPAYPLAWVA